MHGVEGFCGSGIQVQALRDYFYVDTDEWKTQILRQGLQTLAQMVGGLSEPAQSA